MDVSKYFNGWFKGFNNNWLGLKNIGALGDQVKNQFFFYTEIAQRLGSLLSFFRLHELLNYYAVYIFKRILLDYWGFNIWTKFSWLFL